MKKVISIFIVMVIMCSAISANAASNRQNSEDIINYTDIVVSDAATENLYSDDVENEFKEGGRGAVSSIIKYTDNESILSSGIRGKSVSLPSKYKSPYVTSVKDQYNTSNCWVFASLATLESNIMKDISYSDPNFSEEHARQAIYGSRKWYDQSEYKYRVIGSADAAGNQEYISRYILRGNYGGAVEEDNKNLFFIVGQARELSSLDVLSPIQYYPKTTIKLPYFDMTYSEAELNIRINQIKTAIYESGGVVTIMPFSTADTKYVYNYDTNLPEYYHNISKTSYDYVIDNPDFMHCVEIIGWDDSAPIANYKNAPSRNGAFLIKNSWGGSYSYVYVSYDNVDLMQDIMYFDDFTNRNTYSNLYEHDNVATLYPDTNNKDKKLFVSKFNKKTSGTEVLNSVNLDILDVGTKFKIYVSGTGRFEDLNPVSISNAFSGSTSDNKVYTKNAAGNFTVDLSSPISLNGSNFLIGIEYISNSAVSFLTERAYYLDGEEHRLLECRPVINKGETYIYNSGNINVQGSYTDTATLSKPYNTCFKAYTKNS